MTWRRSLFPSFAGCITGIPGGLAFGLQPGLVRRHFNSRAFLLLGLFYRNGLTLCRKAGVLGNALGFPFGQASIPRGAHSCTGGPPFCNRWVIEARPLTKSGDHGLLCILGGT